MRSHWLPEMFTKPCHQNLPETKTFPYRYFQTNSAKSRASTQRASLCPKWLPSFLAWVEEKVKDREKK